MSKKPGKRGRGRPPGKSRKANKKTIKKKKSKKSVNKKDKRDRRDKRDKRDTYKKAFRSAVKKEQAKDHISEEQAKCGPVRTSKFLGYCPKCNGIISTLDRFSKFIYICVSCGKKTRVNRLRVKSEDKKKLNLRTKKKLIREIFNENN